MIPILDSPPIIYMGEFVEIMDEWIEEAKTTSQEHTQRPVRKVAVAR